MKDKIRKEIVKYLADRDLFINEGSSSLEERQYLASLVGRFSVKRVLEIGFSAGFSTYAFLEVDSKVTVVSFDIADHDYVDAAKEFIDEKFPGRHTLIKGDSTETLPRFAKEHPDEKFDLIFVDGGHAYEVAKSDLKNAKELAAPEAVVVIDDLTPWLEWGKGPTKAWQGAVGAGFIEQLELYQDGKAVTETKPSGERAWALGHYR